MKQIIIFFFCLTALGIAQVKISELPRATVQPDTADVLLIIDVSADTTKRISTGLFIKPLLDEIETLEDIIKVQTNNITALTYNQSVILDSLQKIVNLINSFLPLITPLEAPVLASVTPDNDSSFIRLVFSSNVNADSTVIQRSTYTGGFVDRDTVFKNETTYKDSTTLGNTRYYYRLYSYTQAGGVSPYSNVLNGVTVDTASNPEVIADYFIDATLGNDSWDGTTPTTAWKTINKLNSMISLMTSGDTVAFKRGETFNGNLTIGTSGTTFISYGSGVKPIIQTYDSIPNWWNVGSWQNEGGNIWSMSVPTNSSLRINRLWINGAEKKRADLNGRSVYGEQLSATYPFLHNANTLYVYSTSNPASAFYSMKTYVKTDKYFTVEITDKDDITLDGLDIRGGLYGSIGLAGADNIVIKNCNIGKYANRSGIMANGYFNPSNDLSSNNVILKKDTIDSDWNFDYVGYFADTPYGIYGGNSSQNQTQTVNYWTVDSCYIRNWWFGIYFGGLATFPSTSNVISNNEISNQTTWSGGKAIQCYSWSITEGDTTGMGTYHSIYNNYIHDMGGCGISLTCAYNKVYFNIIDSMYLGLNEHITNYDIGVGTGNGGYAFELLGERWGDVIVGNYIYNNTIYSTYYQPINNNTYSYIYNNLWINPYIRITEVGFPVVFYMVDSNIKNNLIFKTGNSSTGYVQEYPSSSFRTVAGLNTRTNSSGNIYSSKANIAEIVTLATWGLPSGSDAIGTALDVSPLLPVGFKDRNGNPFNGDIGAIQTP